MFLVRRSTKVYCENRDKVHNVIELSYVAKPSTYFPNNSITHVALIEERDLPSTIAPLFCGGISYEIEIVRRPVP